MTSGPDLTGQIIGELTGLRIALQSVAGRLAVLSEMGNADLQQMHRGAHDMLTRHEVGAPGISGEEIRARAEHTIDQIFGSMSITIGQSRTE